MWLLSAEQAARLAALQRRRDLQRIAEVLGAAFADARARVGDRWEEFVEHGALRAHGFGLTHMLCVARFLATWVACGAEFEARQPWATAILGDDKRREGAKVFQLCVRVLEQLRSEPQSAPVAALDFVEALRQLDAQLAAAGMLGSLLPRERIRLGAACDLDAVELRLVGTDWRQHYTAEGGAWHREACSPQVASIAVIHDPLAEAAPRWPDQVTLLSRPATFADDAAKLRVRVKTGHRCDAQVHAFLRCLGPGMERSRRGEAAEDSTLVIHGPAADPARLELPHIGEEDSAQLSTLRVSACGLRARGVSVGELATHLAAYDATQHLLAWRRDPAPPWQLPGESPPPVVAARCRRERDGEVADSSAWVRGFHDLDAQLQEGTSRLLTAFERESGVSDGKLAVDASLLVGSAGITWGWAETPKGIAAPPYMRLEALLDLVAYRLSLRFSGVLTRDGSRSGLDLSTDGSTSLSGPWKRGPNDPALFTAAAALQRPVRQGFHLTVQPVADAGLAMLGRSGSLQGAISGAVGLEQRPDGPGLRWFVRLKVEPVSVLLRIVDPLLGVQMLPLPLLPAQTLVDWSQA